MHPIDTLLARLDLDRLDRENPMRIGESKLFCDFFLMLEG